MNSLLLAGALTVEFIGPCSVKPLLEVKTKDTLATSVGEATVSLLEQYEIEFKGSARGLNSAFGTPTGLEAMEVISDDEMRSYGWCYSVDGKVPEDYPDTVLLNGTKRITWFFAYAHYKKGEWLGQCLPAYKIKPAFLCARP